MSTSPTMFTSTDCYMRFFYRFAYFMCNKYLEMAPYLIFPLIWQGLKLWPITGQTVSERVNLGWTHTRGLITCCTTGHSKAGASKSARHRRWPSTRDEFQTSAFTALQKQRRSRDEERERRLAQKQPCAWHPAHQAWRAGRPSSL